VKVEEEVVVVVVEGDGIEVAIVVEHAGWVGGCR
jgi:hypothetical protein